MDVVRIISQTFNWTEGLIPDSLIYGKLGKDMEVPQWVRVLLAGIPNLLPTLSRLCPR